jgi:CRP/FNR family transcriptional regulator, cyclic AMP receptor protein
MGSKATQTFTALAIRRRAGIERQALEYRTADIIFSRGDAAWNVMFIETGGVKLSVLSDTGREAVVAVRGPGDFFGEGCLSGQPIRMETALAIAPSAILAVDKVAMIRLLHEQHGLSDRFISAMLARNIRIEKDLVGQLFDSSERRLARTLLRLARYGTQDEPRRILPKMSQQTLAEMVCTTRPQVKFLMDKFERLGFIEQSLGLKINRSLLSVVLHD